MTSKNNLLLTVYNNGYVKRQKMDIYIRSETFDSETEPICDCYATLKTKRPPSQPESYTVQLAYMELFGAAPISIKTT